MFELSESLLSPSFSFESLLLLIIYSSTNVHLLSNAAIVKSFLYNIAQFVLKFMAIIHKTFKYKNENGVGIVSQVKHGDGHSTI